MACSADPGPIRWLAFEQNRDKERAFINRCVRREDANSHPAILPTVAPVQDMGGSSSRIVLFSTATGTAPHLGLPA